MTTRVRMFQPTPDYHHYAVTLAADRFDSDLGKITKHVLALGPVSAREIALEQVRDEYPDATYLRVEEEDAAYHDECGYAWSVHDNATLLNKLPFGCPSEAYARTKWGDR